MLLLTSSNVLVAVVACLLAFGLIGGLIMAGWLQRPMLEIPPRRFESDPPEEIRRLPERERSRIIQLSRSGEVVGDSSSARLVEVYCRWQIAHSDRLSFLHMPRWRQAIWLGTTAIYVWALIIVITSTVPWFFPVILPMIGLRIGIITGLLPRFLSRKYRRTSRANGWLDQASNLNLPGGQ